MKKLIFLPVLFILICAYLFSSCKQKKPSPEKAISKIVLLQIDSFATACRILQTTAESNSTDEEKLKRLFLQTRLAYKNFEWAAEYFVPATSRFVNGPPVQEVEVFSHQVLEPAGLQVI